MRPQPMRVQPRPVIGNTGYTGVVAKVMVSLPNDVLRAVDMEASRRGTTRSGLLRELAESAMRSRSLKRAERMAEIDSLGGHPKGHGGHVAELVKTTRPEA
jgi:metal-responsive CopG/Arc/MetJ family transcriptional regulator